MRFRRDSKGAFAYIEPDERKRLAGLGSAMLMVGSLTAVPTAIVAVSSYAPTSYAVAAVGFLLGLVLTFLPWGSIAPGWLHVFPIAGTLVVVAGVAVFSAVFSFFMVLAGMFVAISVREPRVFSAYLAFFTLALLLPLTYAGQDLSAEAIPIFATLPVLFTVTLISRYMHEIVESRKEQYLTFATQAIVLAERIRGETNGSTDDSPESLERRLASLTLASSHERRNLLTRPRVWPPSSN